MVHALEQTERLLRAGGTLIDIHPVPEAPRIEVRAGRDIVFSEPSPTYDYEDDLRGAEAAVETMIERGLFTRGPSTVFDFLTYAPSIGELRAHWEVAGAYADEPHEDAALALRAELDARVEEVVRASTREVTVVDAERARMTRLDPTRKG